MSIQKIINQAAQIIRSHLSKEYKAVLFGSWAQGKALKTSDVDIGIIGKNKVPWEIMTEIRQEIENIPTLRSIDIVDLNSVSKAFKNKALKQAKYLS